VLAHYALAPRAQRRSLLGGSGLHCQLGTDGSPISSWRSRALGCAPNLRGSSPGTTLVRGRRYGGRSGEPAGQDSNL